jgi:hypothetical protein
MPLYRSATKLLWYNRAAVWANGLKSSGTSVPPQASNRFTAAVKAAALCAAMT